MPKQQMYIAEATVDDEQREILNKKFEHSHIVAGCAGSGKSCLALLRIKMLAEMDAQPFYLVTFVRSLVEYLRCELRANDMPGECIVTQKEWSQGFITNWCGAKFGIPEQNRQLSREPNYLLVDECQDLPLDVIQKMKEMTRKTIFLYGDDEQQIMGFLDRHPATITQIGTKLNIPIYKLRLNYRLPKKVAAFAQEISGSADLEKHCKNADGEKPYVIRIPHQKDQVEAIIALSNQNHYDDVGILCRTDSQVRSIVQLLRETESSVSARYDIGGSYEYLGNTTRFRVMNTHQAKGQQFEAVFLLMEDNVQYESNVVYVAVTRTYHALYVFFHNDLPAILRNIPLDRYRTSLSELDAPLIQV